MKLKDKIIHCLKKYPEARNSDIRLTNSVWIEFNYSKIKIIDGRPYIALADLYDVPTQESVKRVRAELNSNGLYLPTSEEVLKQRRLLEVVYKEKYSPSNPAIY